jgi:hypothetical protein
MFLLDDLAIFELQHLVHVFVHERIVRGHEQRHIYHGLPILQNPFRRSLVADS